MPTTLAVAAVGHALGADDRDRHTADVDQRRNEIAKPGIDETTDDGRARGGQARQQPQAGVFARGILQHRHSHGVGECHCRGAAGTHDHLANDDRPYRDWRAEAQGKKRGRDAGELQRAPRTANDVTDMTPGRQRHRERKGTKAGGQADEGRVEAPRLQQDRHESIKGAIGNPI